MLSTVNRFNYNFKRYKPEASESEISVPELCDAISHRLYSFRNLLASDLESQSSAHIKEGSLMVLSTQLRDLWYQLHHDIVTYDVNQISDIIPELDTTIRTWNYCLENAAIADIDSLSSQTQLIRRIRNLPGN